MSQTTQYNWRQSDQGFWHRDIDECEQFYRLYTKKEHGCYPVTGCASFKVKDAKIDQNDCVESALRSAWTYLRFKHPTLGSHVETGDQPNKWKRVYRPLETEKDVKSWLDSTFMIIETDKTALSWFNNDAPPFDMPTVYIVKPQLTAQRTLFLRCPHDVTDGVGVLQLLNQLFVHVTKFYGQTSKFEYPLPEMDLGTRLSPSLRVAASIPDSLSEAQMKRFEELRATNGNVYNYPNLMGFPTSVPPNDISHARMKRTALYLSQSTSTKILAACKSIAPGVSLTHVFTSALTMALADFQPRKEEPFIARYVDRPMINIRSHCREPFDSPDHSAAAYHAVTAQALAIDVEVPSKPDMGAKPGRLSELAIKVRDLHQQLKPDPSSDVYEQALFAPSVFETLFPPPGFDPWVVQESPFCPVSLSSVGNLATIMDGSSDVFELTKIWAASQPIGAGVAVFLASWDGKVELSSVFNTQYHGEGSVVPFLALIINYVCQGLGVEVDSCHQRDSI
ncbi:hypothetical protein FLONG3_3539 [Fusarium longipes]|uniref:Uncharacterized protein n=1 Tax=Fusarium longipes TaxID=694270 RepID=A0A395T0X4_9HYPO|nr:hypothetical protein FLONG3_3539 [Fusarium longipes]